MPKNGTDRRILFFLTYTTYKPVKINGGGKQLQLMFDSPCWIWQQSGTDTCTQKLENGYPAWSKDATGKSCSWGVWETTFDGNCCSSTCLDNTENTLQLTKGKCHAFIQTTSFFFFFTQWRCLGGCTRQRGRFVYRLVCQPLPCKWSADTVAALWHGDSAQSRMSSAPLSGITPGRMTEPETAAKVWTYPDKEQGILLNHITTKYFKKNLYALSVSENLHCLTWVRLQQLQEQRYPFLSVWAVFLLCPNNSMAVSVWDF